jgi:hypothetical protein
MNSDTNHSAHRLLAKRTFSGEKMGRRAPVLTLAGLSEGTRFKVQLRHPTVVGWTMGGSILPHGEVF